jgi:subtilisin family serine protease
MEPASGDRAMPSATPDDLANAIVDCVNAGAHVINLSAALAHPSGRSESKLEQALDYSAKHGVIVVAAAGNQSTVGSSVITRHSWVIPVVACNLKGRPLTYSNLGNSIGKRGLTAPGEGVTSLSVGGKTTTFSGTSAAAPFVTGTIALLRSIFPNVSSADLKLAVTQRNSARASIVPPLLNAWDIYERLRS